MKTYWRLVKDILIDRGWFAIFDPAKQLYECADCGFVLRLLDKQALPENCSNCTSVVWLAGTDDDACAAYETLNSFSSLMLQIELLALEPIDLLHSSCDCPECNICTPTNVYTSCEYTSPIEHPFEDNLAPICPVCNGCCLCRIYISDQATDDYL